LYLSFPALSYLLLKEVESWRSRIFFIFVLTFSLTFVALDNFYWGQVNILVTFLVLSSLVLTTINRSRLSALFLTLAIFTKMTPAFYLFYFLYQKKYREIVYTVFFSLSIFLLTYFSGKENWLMFLQVIQDVGNTQTVIRGLMPTDISGNLSLNGLVARILPFSFSYKREILYFLNSTMITICAYLAYLNRQKPKSEIFFLQLTIISILVTPMTWYHHFTALYPAGILLFLETFRKNIFKERKLFFSMYFICLMTLSRITNLLVTQLQTGWFFPSLLNSLHTMMILLLFVFTIFNGKKLENSEGEKSPSVEKCL
ncbi:MAG: DUF2029 domain-containing protein, partial [Leptospiraceae bacterium]|nr:DUF2029 domain-containing protein [Leptospiraceae bacterium]